MFRLPSESQTAAFQMKNSRHNKNNPYYAVNHIFVPTKINQVLDSKIKTRPLWLAGSILGLLIVAVLPPFQGPDEFNHFFRAYQVSTGQWLGVRTPDQRLGGLLPTSLYTIAQPFRQLPFHHEHRISVSTITTAFHVPLQPEQTQFIDFANTAIYAPTAYLPQAVVIAPLRWLQAPPLLMLYAGRIAGLLWWLTCFALALRWRPVGPALWMAWALLPSALALHTTLTADTVTHGLCFVLLAWLLRRAGSNSEPMHGKDWMLLILMTVAIAVHKIIYAPLVALAALGWRQPKRQRNTLIITAALIAVSAVAIAGWNQVTRSLFIPYDAYHLAWRDTQQLNEGVDPAAQLGYILQHPGAFARTAVVSLCKTAPSATANYLGKFGWEKNYLPWPLIAALLIGLLALTGTVPDGAAVFDCTQRGLLLGCATAMTVGLAIIMYLLWNPVGAPFIHNLGGKYFIPIIPVALLAFVNGNFVRWRVPMETAFLALLVCSNLWMIGQIVVRYILI